MRNNYLVSTCVITQYWCYHHMLTLSIQIPNCKLNVCIQSIYYPADSYLTNR